VRELANFKQNKGKKTKKNKTQLGHPTSLPPTVQERAKKNLLMQQQGQATPQKRPKRPNCSWQTASAATYQ
jgi:hypothetical protein